MVTTLGDNLTLIIGDKIDTSKIYVLGGLTHESSERRHRDNAHFFF